MTKFSDLQAARNSGNSVRHRQNSCSRLENLKGESPKNMGVASLTVAVCFAAEAFVQILRHHGFFIRRRAPHPSIRQNCNDNPSFIFLAASMATGDL